MIEKDGAEVGEDLSKYDIEQSIKYLEETYTCKALKVLIWRYRESDKLVDLLTQVSQTKFDELTAENERLRRLLAERDELLERALEISLNDERSLMWNYITQKWEILDEDRDAQEGEYDSALSAFVALAALESGNGEGK